MKQYDIEDISIQLIECITDLLDHFNIEYIDGLKSISFKCPVHDGDNEFGSSILKQDIGNWQCYTQQCHEPYGTSSGAGIIHFVQATLSTKNEKEYTFIEALDWCAKFVGADEVRQTPENVNRTQFIQLCKYLNPNKKSTPTFTPRATVKDFLAIPSSYYIKRGYSREVLQKFDVGYCHNTKKPFYDRVVTPFYDDEGEYMIGCSGRSCHERCPKCRLFHGFKVRCPITKDEKLKCSKWKNNSLFQKDSYLYNYWNAKSHIAETGIAILVEGAGDVWRFEEAGVYNSLAMLGAKLSPGQQYILEGSGAISLIIATDNDDAGRKAARSITEQCKQMFNIHVLKYEEADPGSMSLSQINEALKPILEKL